MTELANAVAAYYPLMADTDDYSGHLASATPTAGVSYGPGPFGSAPEFHHLGSAIALPAIYPANGLGSYALTAWVRLDGYGAVAGDPDKSGAVVGCLRVRHDDGIAVFDFSYTTSAGSLQTVPLEAPTPLPLGQWTHLVAIYDVHGPAIRLLFNGSVVAEGPIPPGVAPAEPTLGRAGAAAADGSRGVLNGAIGHLAFFSDDFTAACAAALAGYLTYPVPPAATGAEPDDLFTAFVVLTVLAALIPVVNKPRYVDRIQRQKSETDAEFLEKVAERIAAVAGAPVNPKIRVTRREVGFGPDDRVKLDVGGYGVYRELGGTLSGIPGTLNLNDHPTNPNSSPPGQAVRALVLMPGWDGNPDYPFEDEFADYIVMQSAPLTPTNSKEIERVLRIGGSVGLWIDQDRFGPAIADLAKKLNCTPLPCTAANGNLGMDEMGGNYVFPKVQLTKEKPVSNPGTITLYNGGAYVARLKLKYTLNSAEVSKETDDITVWTSKSLDIPAGAIDIFVTAIEHTGFGWNEIGTHGFGSPVTRCYECEGTTFNPTWKEYDCPALEAKFAGKRPETGEKRGYPTSS
jgi:hypothetical protein